MGVEVGPDLSRYGKQVEVKKAAEGRFESRLPVLTLQKGDVEGATIERAQPGDTIESVGEGLEHGLVVVAVAHVVDAHKEFVVAPEADTDAKGVVGLAQPGRLGVEEGEIAPAGGRRFEVRRIEDAVGGAIEELPQFKVAVTLIRTMAFIQPWLTVAVFWTLGTRRRRFVRGSLTGLVVLDGVVSRIDPLRFVVFLALGGPRSRSVQTLEPTLEFVTHGIVDVTRRRFHMKLPSLAVVDKNDNVK